MTQEGKHTSDRQTDRQLSKQIDTIAQPKQKKAHCTSLLSYTFGSLLFFSRFLRIYRDDD